ncbi:outer membrane beta-barrel protein [Polaribacter atrinae]|uniref:outer membrane beta-barrel protein n=1 Tax=Polaribacter atrinae TaxID=1333662 RepID=UPI002492468D|nr:outer membrane beta-barrel protein [Polaribacter atrinae]
MSFYAQESSKWKIGIEYSMDKLSIDNGQNNDFLVTEGNINGYGIEFDKNNHTIGVITQFLFNEKISVSSGLLYSNKDFTGTYSCGTCDFIGTFPGYSPETLKQRFLVIPISIDYNFQLGNLEPILKAGFKSNIEIDNDLKQQSKGYFLEAFVGVLINYEILETWNIGVGYNYQTALTDLYKSDNYNLRTNSFYLQINYHIK